MATAGSSSSHPDAQHRQVMSPMMGVIPEGSEAEPNYGAVARGTAVEETSGRAPGQLPNGVVPVEQGQRSDLVSDSVRAPRKPLVAHFTGPLSCEQAGIGETVRRRLFPLETGPGATNARTSEPPAQPTTAPPLHTQPQQPQQQLVVSAPAQPRASGEGDCLPEHLEQAVDAKRGGDSSHAGQGPCRCSTTIEGNPFAPVDPPPPLPSTTTTRGLGNMDESQ